MPRIPAFWWGWDYLVPDDRALAPIAVHAPTVGICSDAMGAGLELSLAWWAFCLFYPAGVIGCSGYRVCCLDRCGGVTESQSLKLVHSLGDLHT